MDGEPQESDSEPGRPKKDSDSDDSSSDGEPAKSKPKIQAKKKRKKKKKSLIKRASSAYMFFSKEIRAKIVEESKSSGTKMTFAEIAREVSRRWSLTSPEEKVPYQELNKKDKLRYEEELANAPPPDPDSDSDSDEKPVKKKKKKKRDPNLPKRPKTGFFFYLDKQRQIIAEEFPNMKMSERSKLLGQRWQKLTDEEKAPFIALNAKAKEEYKVAMVNYNRNKVLEGGGD